MNPQNDGVKDVQQYIEKQQKAVAERSFAQRQREIREHMKRTMAEACKKLWFDQGEYQKFLDVCERFNRQKDIVGCGISNALLIYARNPGFTYLVTNQERMEKKWKVKKGEAALDIFLPTRKKDPETGEWQIWQNPIKAFDVSQFAEPLPPSEAVDPPKRNIRDITAAIVSGQGKDTYLTRYDDTVPTSAGCAFIPSQFGGPAQMIMSTKLTKEEYTQAVFVCISHYMMSQRDDEYSFGPETNFIAKSAAYILCKRYGLTPERVEVFPPDIENPGAIKEIISTVVRTSNEGYRHIEDLMEAHRVKENSIKPPDRGELQ